MNVKDFNHLNLNKDIDDYLELEHDFNQLKISMKNNNKIKKLSILLILYISSTVIAISQNNSNFQKENRDALKIAFFISKWI